MDGAKGPVLQTLAGHPLLAGPLLLSQVHGRGGGHLLQERPGGGGGPGATGLREGRLYVWHEGQEGLRWGPLSTPPLYTPLSLPCTTELL